MAVVDLGIDMAVKKPIVAIVYDFDRTLCTTDMQEYTLIPELKQTPETFWGKCDRVSREEGMDGILAYMKTILDECRKNGKPVRRESFRKHGRSIRFYPGVKDWFRTIDQAAKDIGVSVQHYVISSGLKEIIEGTDIHRSFERIYACEYFYDENGEAVWPKMAVNYTDKTQFLFRINKGLLDVSEHAKLNEFMYDEDRPVPFTNMIYIGDGLTDVPCMKMVKDHGGHSIAVYSKSKDTARRLMSEGRVDFVCKADYSQDRDLYGVVTGIMRKVACDTVLSRRSRKDLDEARSKLQ